MSLGAIYTVGQSDDHFETWMMYRPPSLNPNGNDSMFVPIKKIVWFWQGDAVKINGVWNLLSSDSDFTIGANYPEFPLWTGRVTPTALSTWINN